MGGRTQRKLDQKTNGRQTNTGYSALTQYDMLSEDTVAVAKRDTIVESYYKYAQRKYDALTCQTCQQRQYGKHTLLSDTVSQCVFETESANHVRHITCGPAHYIKNTCLAGAAPRLQTHVERNLISYAGMLNTTERRASVGQCYVGPSMHAKENTYANDYDPQAKSNYNVY